MLEAEVQQVSQTGRRVIIFALAAVVLCFQLMLAMHPYSHSLSEREAACQTCLLGSHSPPPVQAMASPRPSLSETHDPLILVPLPVIPSIAAAHRPRAPPHRVLPS